jgi:hypothetical protein
LGLFLGAKRFGEEVQKVKRCLVFDIEPYRYQKFISDLSGIDVTAHGGDARQMVKCTRDWLVTVSRRRRIPSPAELLDSYDRFIDGLPPIAASAGLDAESLGYPDFERLVLAWVRADHLAGALP